MRIVAGEWRGRPIEAPAGENTRPTTDRVREALMSSLFSVRGGFDGAVVLDAFAGSGALGLEALSRGAQSCRFYDRDAKAQAAVARNIAALKLPASRAQLSRADVMTAPPERHRPPFDLVFLDPPYAMDAHEACGMLERLRAAGALADGALVVYEHANKDAAAVASALEDAGFAVLRAKKYGKTGTVIARADERAAAAAVAARQEAAAAQERAQAAEAQERVQAAGAQARAAEGQAAPATGKEAGR
jgi:16S rRNA (guanine966-N2)-methyltransferase